MSDDNMTFDQASAHLAQNHAYDLERAARTFEEHKAEFPGSAKWTSDEERQMRKEFEECTARAASRVASRVAEGRVPGGHGWKAYVEHNMRWARLPARELGGWDGVDSEKELEKFEQEEKRKRVSRSEA